MSEAFGCVNNTIRLASGRYFDLANPSPDDFEFVDINKALAKICRFGGHCERFYSVAEHLIHCTNQAEEDGLPLEVQRSVFMHDAAEAFIGDMVKPLKVMLPDYKAVEKQVEFAIELKFSIDLHNELIKKIDHEMLIAERHFLFSKDNMTWTGENEVRKISPAFKCYDPEQAEFRFWIKARRLGLT